MTINEILCLTKAVRERIAELRTLRSEVSVKEVWYGDKDKSKEPQYDIKAVDKKITELELFLYRADSKIKQSNAITDVDLVVTVEKLLEPLQ